MYIYILMIYGFDYPFRRAIDAAVIAYREKIEAEKDRDHYKQLQNSSGFGRVGIHAREMLDNERKEVEEKVMVRSAELKSRIDRLVRLPETSNSFFDLRGKLDEQD